MAEFTLAATIEVLRKYHQKKINVGNTAAELITNGYYLYLEVCEASLNYWFRFFNEHPYRFSYEYPHICVTPEERLAFLSVLIKNNRFWNLKHFVDALKVSKTTVRCDINRLGYVWGSQGWTQRIRTSQ